VILVRAITCKGEIMVPMSEIKDEMKMEAFTTSINHLEPPIVFEALQGLVCPTQSTAPNDL
jgi:hypothetical protein